MAERRTTFQLLTSGIDIRYEDPALDRPLRYLVGTARQPFEIRRTLSYEVRGTGPYELREEGDLLGEVPDPLDVQYVVYGRVYKRVVERLNLTGWVAFHGALATVGGQRTMVCGHKGAGKSTLSTRLLYSGYAVEGDEMVLVRDGVALPMPRAFHLKPGIAAQVPELARAVDDLPKAYAGALEISAFDPGAAGFGWAIAMGPVDRVVWLTPNHGGETRLEPRPSFVTMRQLLDFSLDWGEPPDVLVAAASGLAARGGFELTLGDAAAAVALLDAGPPKS